MDDQLSPNNLPRAQVLAEQAFETFHRFLHVEAVSGDVLLTAAAVALIWANSPFAHSYHAFWHLSFSIGLGEFVFSRSLHFWINDGLMTVFFLVIGMEIRREIRFERASVNALAIARYFEKHPAIERVLYPGLESHPGHDVARRQMTNGYGGMLSIKVHGGFDAAARVASGLKIFLAAASLGGVESLAEHRAAVEGPNSIVPPNLLRLSVGIETVADLIADLSQGLDRLT